ncbi:PAS domain S-box-containing protein [Pedobacter sp. CG_S7]|uniref:PAS domain S-box protein n=1 Tax=Pedobacter sp. CG_S7 TaxID=3143930 RepID=UPI00339A00F6
MNISEEEFREIFYHSPIAKLIISATAADYAILDVNNAYLLATQTERASLIGKSVFSAFPENPIDHFSKNNEKIIISFEQAKATKKPDILNRYRYDISISGTDQFLEKYWTATNTPILDENGAVKMIIHSPCDVTDLYFSEKRKKKAIIAIKNQRKQLYSIFMQAPVGIGIFLGPDFIVDMVNPRICKIYGKNAMQMIGEPVFDVLPFAKGQGFEELLNHVRITGETYEGMAIEVPLIRNGLLEKVYVDFVYEPFYEDENTISGVIVVTTEVTAKVMAMRKLEEAEERARLAADAVDLGVYDLNILNGEIITSKRFANIFGFEETQLHKDYISAIHPDDVFLRKLAHEKAIEKGQMNYESRIIWPDKSLRWVRIEGKVIKDKKNNPIRILGTILDITALKQDKEQEKKLITLVDNSVELMSIFNMEGIPSYINTAGMELLGLESIEKLQNLEFFQPEILTTLIREGSWAGKMMIHNYTSGEVFPVFNNCIRIDDNVTGKPIAVGAVMRDLRPELSAKQALADSEQLLRNITRAAPTALWMSNRKGEITYVNQTWIDWSGNTFQENLLYGWMSIILPEDLKLVVELFQNAIHSRQQYDVEFRIDHADGSQHWCVALGQPQFNEIGEFSGYIGSCTDITEHKELQDQKDNFIGIASHELKTPVTSLKGYAQVLERILKKKGHEAEADMMRKMDTQLNRLTSLIGDLLDVTKINSGKLQFNDRIFELQPMLSELVQDLQFTTEKHTLIENFKPTGKTYADKEQIEQVIINLLTNAIKYSPDANKIIIHMEQVNDEIIVGIEDFGIGISAEEKARVFEQFYRVSGKMQHTFSGLGLGLYISAEIIKRVGGRIWVESKESQGSCFYFSLPVYT